MRYANTWLTWTCENSPSRRTPFLLSTLHSEPASSFYQPPLLTHPFYIPFLSHTLFLSHTTIKNFPIRHLCE